MDLDKWALDEEKDAFKLSEESAAKCVKELITFYHIDIKNLATENLKASVSQAFDVLQDGYRRGALENKRTDDGGLEVIQHIKDGTDKLVYRELTAKIKRAMDGYAAEVIFERQQALLGALCGLGKDAIGSLKRYDLHIAEALGSIFFIV
jgi:hypothetical protein